MTSLGGAAPPSPAWSAGSAIAARSSIGGDSEERIAAGIFPRAAEPDDADPTGSGAGSGSPATDRHPRAADPDLETASISSSVREHIYEGGMRYHAYHAGKYAFPNDEVEQVRDDMKHGMVMMLCNDRLFFAPVEEALERDGEVLDLGKLRIL